MTSRMALGSVSTLAVGAMLLGAMPYLISRGMGSSHTVPWGALSSLRMDADAGAPANGARVSEADKAQLLKLASLKTAAPAASPVTGPTPVAAPLQPVSAANAWQGTLQRVATVDPAPAVEQSQSAQSDTAPATAQDTAPPAAENGQKSASVETPATDAKPQAPTRPAVAAGGAVNINTASMETLDRFPGVGRVGHAIMVHRPYRSVADLLKKRVLRTSDYEKIQSRIRVD